MISVDQALGMLQARVPALPPCQRDIDDALGRRLAADVVSPRDVPPFDKSLMDGIALRSQDLRYETDTVRIVGTVMAGEPFAGTIQAEQALRIMTGGVVPPGCDCVIAQELTDISPEGIVRSRAVPRPGDHMMRRGELVRAGDTVLAAGRRIRAAQWALLREIGCHHVVVRPRIRAAVLATGTELVDRIEDATEGRIANTNGPMLTALLQDYGCDVTPLGVAADDTELLRQKIQAGLQADLLVTSGGVSTGDRDLVPATLAASGVQPWFHRVRMKPGKPLWFGTTESGTVVVGLPGNPVSAYVGFQLFVRTALSLLTGEPRWAPQWHRLPSDQPWQGKTDRETYWPARLRSESDSPNDAAAGVELLPWKGSSDLRTLAAATGLVRIRVGTAAIAAGELVDYMPCESEW